MLADVMTASLKAALAETNRRREKQHLAQFHCWSPLCDPRRT